MEEETWNRTIKNMKDENTLRNEKKEQAEDGKIYELNEEVERSSQAMHCNIKEKYIPVYIIKKQSISII